MARHLLLVNLGPIQDFIASARRCQDLWFGSKLLSELAAAVARGIADKVGVDSLILPGKLAEQSNVSVANKILVLVPEEIEPAMVAAAGKASMVAHRDAITTRLFDRIKGPRWDRDLAEKQVADLIEYVWVAAPLRDDYKASRQQVEGLLSARKRTKSWGSVPWERVEGIPKSSVDGKRESVLQESLFDDVKNGRLSPEELRRTYYVKKSERLCGVGMLKRIGQIESENGEPQRFHSTSHVATGPLLVRIARLGQQGSDAIDQYASALGAIDIDMNRFRLRYGDPYETEDPIAPGPSAPGKVSVARTFGKRSLDGYILYEDRLRDMVEMDSTVPLSERAMNEQVARDALKAFLKAVGHAAPPPAYYAFMLADGDHMGDALDAIGDSKRHQEFSMALEEFAQGCRSIVAEHGGSLIYSGGDDVLALLPLHTALGCAVALRESFGRIKSPQEGKELTLSVGLGIAHHMDAMDEARALAKEAEQSAKKSGRNALGIMVSKRSGAAVAMCAPWGKDPAGRLRRWCQLLRDEELPDGVAFELEEEVALFDAPGPDETPDEKARAPSDLNAVVHALARRIIGRKRRDRGEEPISESVAALLCESFDGSKDPIAAVRRLSSEIQIARLFLEAHESAWGKINQ